MSYEGEPMSCTYDGGEAAELMEGTHSDLYYVVENIPDGEVNDRKRYYVCSNHVDFYQKYPHLYKVEGLVQ